MNALMVADRSIRLDDAGRLSLNDLHRAGGGANKDRPSQWLANRQTKDLIAELNAEAGIPALAIQRGGARAGTYACREAALAFAAWISPSFHVRVLRAADAVLTGQVQHACQGVHAALRNPETLRALLAEQVDERLRLEQRVAEQTPRVAAFDRIAGLNGAVCLREAAKLLGVRESQFLAWMSDHAWLFRERDYSAWQSYARRIDDGHMLHVMVPVTRSDGRQTLRAQAKVTPAGLARLALLLDSPSTDNDRSSP